MHNSSPSFCECPSGLPQRNAASPDSAALRLAFSRTETRTLRKDDRTIVVKRRRFSAGLLPLEVRYASWELSLIHFVDKRTGKVLSRLFLQDTTQDASGLRRTRDPTAKEPPATPPAAVGIAPLLQKLLKQQSETGLPPAYLPKDERPKDQRDE